MKEFCKEASNTAHISQNNWLLVVWLIFKKPVPNKERGEKRRVEKEGIVGRWEKKEEEDVTTIEDEDEDEHTDEDDDTEKTKTKTRTEKRRQRYLRREY